MGTASDGATRSAKRRRSAPPTDLEQHPTCYLCLGGAGRVTRSGVGAELLHGGCACRGSAGHGHLRCFIEAATHNWEGWFRCPTCGQRFTGVVLLGLARGCWALQAGKPANDRDKLFAQDLLAQALMEAGRYDEALPLFRAVLAVERRVAGDEGTETLASMNNLAALLATKGDRKAAESLFREGLKVVRRTLGSDHQRTLSSISNLGALLREMSQFEEARRLLEEAVAGRRRTQGDTHVETLNCIDKLASLHHDQGDFVLAEPLDREALAGRRLALGARHPNTLRSLHNLATLLREKDELREAETLAKEAFQGRRAVLPPGHPHIKNSIELLADIRKAIATGEGEYAAEEAAHAAEEHEERP